MSEADLRQLIQKQNEVREPL